MFKRVSGWRAWVLGAGGVLGVLTGLIGYADLAKAVLPERYKSYVPLVMMFGFACALAAVGWDTQRDDSEPSIVIHHRTLSDQDEETGEYLRYDYLIFRNVGKLPLTCVTIDQVPILDISVRPSTEIQALVPSEAEMRVQLYSLGVALDKVRRYLRAADRNEPAAYVIKLTVRCLDWKQRESYAMDYALTYHRSGRSDVRRVRAGDAVEWTDFDALTEPQRG